MSLFGPPDVAKMKVKRDVNGLVKALGYLKDARIRCAAANALGEIGDIPNLDPLIAALHDRGDFSVRTAVAEALGQINDKRAIEPLIAALGDNSAAVRRAAANALGRFGAPAVAPLLAKLGDGDSSVREAAAEALDKLDWKPQADADGAAYWIAKGEVTRCVTIGAPAVAPLITRLGDSNDVVRNAAAEALGKIGDARAVDPLIARLSDTSDAVRKAATEALGKIGAPAVGPLIVMLDDRNFTVRIAAVEALGAFGLPAIDSLIAKLGDYNGGVQEAAANALGKIGAPAIDPLIARLGDKSFVLREGSAKTLDKIGWKPKADANGVAYWIAKGEVSPCVAIGAPAVAPLIAELHDSFYSPDRRAIIEVLGNIRDERAIESLIAALGDNSADVRRAAANALSRFGAPAVAPLLAKLGDGDSSVREAAIEALDKLDWKPQADADGAAYWIAKGEVTRCVAIGAPAVDPLIARLSSNRYEDRAAAATVLVMLYSNPSIDSASKRRILGMRATITSPTKIGGVDYYEDDHGCRVHVDEREITSGIGVDFPL